MLGARVGAGLRVNGPLDICLHPKGQFLIGNGCRIQSGFTDNPVGGFRRTGIWVGPGGILHLGNGVGVSGSTIVAMREVTIGDEVFIGGDCKIYDTDFHQINAEGRIMNTGPVGMAPVRLGRRAFLGGHSIVLKGVSIGEEAIIGAGSVVTRDVPAGEIWAGVPARFVRRIAGSQ